MFNVPLRAQLSTRIVMLLLRHSRAEEMRLSDRDFIQAIIDRWQKDRAAEIVDVNE
jgi:hypothetical protein